MKDILWDMGAQQTCNTSDILSDRFQTYLTKPVHDPYRLNDMVRVQTDIVIGLINIPILFSMIAVVVPKESMPNSFSGIVFGQSSGIERLSYQNISHQIVLARGGSMDDNLWRELLAHEYIDDDGNLVSC